LARSKANAGKWLTSRRRSAGARESEVPEWQAVIEALMLVADLGGPPMFARFGVMRALNRHHARAFNPKEREPYGGWR
jgi:hypothetical protein